MDTASLRAGLARFTADLTIAGEPVTFDVVVARHLQMFVEADRAGLTTPRIARLLAKAGARRADGKPITADQIRASISRAKRRPTSAPGPRDVTVERPIDPGRSNPVQTNLGRPSIRAPAAAPVPSKPRAASRSTALAQHDDADVSDADLRAASERLRRL